MANVCSRLRPNLSWSESEFCGGRCWLLTVSFFEMSQAVLSGGVNALAGRYLSCIFFGAFGFVKSSVAL